MLCKCHLKTLAVECYAEQADAFVIGTFGPY